MESDIENNLQRFKRQNSKIQQSLLIKKITTEFTNLSYDVLHEIFDYLSFGDIYYTFYHINRDFATFIDNTYTCLNLSTMSFRHFQYYRDTVHHRDKVESMKISNEQSFDQIDEFYFHSISLYSNLKKLHLHLPTENYLSYLPKLVPNLTELYLIPRKQIFSNINWLSSFQNLEICSITPKDHGIEISNRMQSLSENLSSLSITLLSTYDLYTLIPVLPTKTLRCLNVSLFDSEFSYMKTCRLPITLATKLTDFTFDLSLVPIRSAASLYKVIQFVTDLLRSVSKLTILCRFADEIHVDEDKLRHYLSFAYSVKELKLFIEMKNLSNFDQKAFAYPFWTDRNVHVNISRKHDKQIQRVCIYTLPLTRKIANLLNESQEIDDSIPNQCSTFEITQKNQAVLFVNLHHHPKTFTTIYYLKLDLDSFGFFSKFEGIYRIFPCVRSISINEIDCPSMFVDLLSTFLKMSSKQRRIIHLQVSGTFFDGVCSTSLCHEDVRANFNRLYSPLFEPYDIYTIALDRVHRAIYFWF